MRPCPECQQQLDDDARFCPFCGSASAAPEPADPMVGATINQKFKVEKMIGQGGMGKVYRARHLTLDRPVVLKMLHRAYSDDPQVVQRFQREARAASRLNHPNSIAVLDFGAAEDGTLFMAMEFLGGRDLSRVVAEDFPLAEGRIVRIGAQILSALAEAHAQGIIHRDLKPENVMVEARRDEADFVKVLDFGIAKITAGAENEPKLTQAGLVCGTPEYMSPEQARGAELDARSDLYSVGVILYQLATGELPFQSDTPVGFLTKHLVEVPVPPRQKRPEVSAPLDALIRKAMEKDRAKRFADAEAMRQALLACATAQAAPARPATPLVPQPTIQLDVTEVEPEEAPPAPAPTPARAHAPVPAKRPPARAAPAPAAAPAAGKSRVPLIAGGVAVLVAAVVAVVVLGGKSPPAAPTTAPANPPPAVPAAANPASPPASAEPPPATPAAGPAATPASGEPVAAAPSPPAEPVPEPAKPVEKPIAKPVVAAAPTTPAAFKPDRARAQRLLDQARSKLPGDPKGALVLLAQAERADPSLAEVHKRAATAHQLAGDLPAAKAELVRYLATNPPDAAKVRAILATLE